MPYASVPDFIHDLKEIRGGQESLNINTAILLFSAAMVEGFVSDVCYIEVENQIINSEFESRLNSDLKRKIIEASWGEYPKLFDLVFNIKLSKCCKKTEWEAIQVLFQYRNFLIHGQPTIYEKYEIYDKVISEYSGKLKNIYDFLVKNKLAIKGNVGFLTSAITDFFFQKTVCFVIQLFNEVENENNQIIKDHFVVEINKYICV